MSNTDWLAGVCACSRTAACSSSSCRVCDTEVRVIVLLCLLSYQSLVSALSHNHVFKMEDAGTSQPHDEIIPIM